MTAYYDKIAAQFKASKTLPFRKHVEWFSYKNMLGNVANKSILDLACGEGFYTRRIKQNGAVHVVGVDLSAEGIQQFGRSYWEDFLDYEPIVGIVCSKE